MLYGFLALLLCLPSCTVKKFVADRMPPSMDDQKLSFYREYSVRHAREAAPAMLKLLDGFIVSSPDNPELLVRGAELNCGFAFLLIEDEDPEWASILYQKGWEYAVRALAYHIEDVKGVLNGPVDRLKETLKGMDRDALRAVFWAGMCLGPWVNLHRDDPMVIAELPKALAFISRAVEIDDRYFFGCGHMFLGVYYGSLSKALGGDPDLSRRHFESAFEVTNGKFLLAKVMYAMTYAVQVQDKNLFTKILEGVLETPDNIDRDMVLANQVAKKKAKVLLEKVDDLFIE